MPKSTDTIYNSNFNDKLIFLQYFFCKIFTKFTYINSLTMLYKLIDAISRLLKHGPQLKWYWTILYKCLVGRSGGHDVRHSNHCAWPGVQYEVWIYLSNGMKTTIHQIILIIFRINMHSIFSPTSSSLFELYDIRFIIAGRSHNKCNIFSPTSFVCLIVDRKVKNTWVTFHSFT